jgi:hypothetical protein
VLARSDAFSQLSCMGPKMADEASIDVWRFSLFAPLYVRMSSAKISTSGPSRTDR